MFSVSFCRFFPVGSFSNSSSLGYSPAANTENFSQPISLYPFLLANLPDHSTSYQKKHLLPKVSEDILMSRRARGYKDYISCNGKGGTKKILTIGTYLQVL